MTEVSLLPRMTSHVEAALAALSSRRGAVLGQQLPEAGAPEAAADRRRVLSPAGGACADDRPAVPARST